MKKTSKANATSHPHVKWGSLIFAIIFILVSLAIIVMNSNENFSNLTNDSNSFISWLFACSLIFALFFFLIGFNFLINYFIPSYTNFRAKKVYISDCRKAIRTSIRSNMKKDSELYNKFLDANPKYRDL